METKKNDWLATLMFNDDKSLDDLKRLNITPDNTGLKPIDDYKNIPEVQERFKNKDTDKFDEKAFGQFYNNAKLLYNDYANNEFLDKAIGGYEYSADAWFAPIDSKVKDEAPRYIINNTPTQQSQGISYITETGLPYNQNLSIRELAQQEKAVDFVTGKELDFTPNEKGGLFKSLSRPTLVLAQYDSDGWHEENGVRVEHKKGDLKYNKNGKPYYETLGSRDMYGKDVLHYVDTITVDGSAINKFDFLDSDGKEKSLAGTLVRTAAAVAPMFIPNGVGQVYGAITLAAALARFVPTLGKTIDSFITGTDNNGIGRDLSKLEGWTESMFNWQTVSDKSRDNLLTAENLGNMVGAISGQLFQQKLVGAIPMMLNRAGSAAKNAELGRNLALAYMAGTSAQQVYGDFKEAGATDWVAGAATLGSMLALYGLMNQDYFRDRLFKYTFMDETGVKVPALNVAKDVDAKILQATGKEATQAEAAGLVNRFRKMFTETIPKAISSQEWLDRSASEAIEEMMEEGVSDAFKGVTSIFNGLGIKVKENDTLDFGFSGKDVLARYGMSALGGFIGGGIFHAQSKYDTWYQEKFHHRLKNDIADDDFKRLVYFIAQGEGDNIRGWYTKWWKQGKLGSTNLSADSEVLSYIDGDKISQKIAQKGELTQNDVVYATLMNTISELEQAIKAEGTGRWLDDSELEKIQARGFDPFNKNIINAHVMVELGSISRFNNDFYDVLSNLVSKKLDLKAKVEELEKGASTEGEKKAETNSINKDEEIKALKAEIKELEDKKEKFLNGEYNKYYAGQSMFILNKNLSKFFTNVSDVRDFVLLKTGEVFDDLSKDQQESWKEEFEHYKATEGTDKILNGYDLYLGFSQQWAPIIQEQAAKLKNVKWDEIHDLEYEGQQFSMLIQEFKALEDQKEELQSKNPQEGTEEAEKLRELSVKAENIKSKIDSIRKNPQFILFTMFKDGKYKELNDFFLKENFSDLDQLSYLQELENFYTEVSNKKGFLVNDDNLNGFFNLLKKLWNSGGPALDHLNQSIDEYIIQDLFDADYETARMEVTKDRDELIDDANLETPFKLELASMLSNAISYFGSDNKLFVAKVKEIENVLLARTNLNKEQVKGFIDYVLPKCGTMPILEIIQHFDNLKKNIIYSPFEELFKNISYSINGENINIVELLNSESKNLANAERVEDYIMSKNSSEIFDKKHYVTLYKAILGVITGAYDNTNALINSFAGGTIENLYELDENTAHILLNQAKLMFGKIDMLKAISDANKQASLRIQKDIEFNMRPKLIKAFLTEEFAAAFDKIFKPHSTGDDHYLTSEWRKLVPSNFDWNKVDESNYTELNEAFIKFETILGDAIRNSEIAQKGDKEVAKALFELINGNKDSKLYKRVSTQLSTENEETIEQFDKLYRLACLYAVPADVYAAHQAKVLQSENLEVAPIYGQDYNDQLAISMIAKTEFFNDILDEICSPEHIILDEKINGNKKEPLEKWFKAHPILHNFIMIAGGAGTGKTTGVVKYLMNFIDGFENTEIVSLAPTSTQAKNLANSINQTSSKVFGKNDFIKQILGKEIEGYESNKENGMMDAKVEIPDSYKDSIFDKASKLKLLIIDEVTLFTKDELSIISDWAETNGVKIIGLGDVKQNSAKVGTVENDVTKYTFTGIEDCFYLKGPELTASLRTLNEAKRMNYNVMNTILRKITKDYAKNPHWEINDLNSQCPADISLVYYESPDKQTLLGEKLVKTDDEIFATVERLKGKGTIAIVTDNLDKYSTKYATDKNITIISTTAAQGGEYDYVVVDKDFKKDNTIGGNLSKFSALRDLYTLSQRSRTATIILDNHLTEIFNIKDNASKPEYNQIFEAPKEDEINKFKQWKLETIYGFDNDTIFDLISKELEKTPEPTPEPKTTDEVVEEEVVEEGNPADGTPEGKAEEEAETEPQPKPKKEQLPPKNPEVEEEVGEKSKPQEIKEEKPKEKSKKKKNAIKFSLQEVQDYYLNNNIVDFELGKKGIPYNSLMKFIGKELTGSELDKYIHLNYDVASYILAGEDIPKSLLNQVADLITNNGSKKPPIMSLVKSKPEIYAVPYDSNKSRIVARFTNGSDSFDITLAFINGLVSGKYSGEFKLKTAAKLIESNDLVSLQEFKKKNPFAIISDIWGVLTSKFKKVKNAVGISKGTRNFLLRKNKDGEYVNLGNTWTAIASSRAIADKYFGNVLFEREGENAITGYGKYAFAGIEKVGNIKDVIKYVLGFAKATKPVPTEIRKLIEDEWFDHSSIKDYLETISSKDIEDVMFGGENNKKRDFRKYQIIPAENLGKLVQAIMSADSKYLGQTNINLKVFLESAVKPNGKRRGESKGLVLTYGEDSFAVEPVLDKNLNYTGELIVRRWNDGSIDNEEYARIPFSKGNQDYKYICQSLFGPEVTSVETTAFARVFANSDNDEKIVTIAPNELLYVLFAGMPMAKAEGLADAIQNSDNFKYGIMFHMHGDESSNDFGSESFFKPFKGAKENIVIRATGITPEVYELNLSEFESGEETPAPAPKPAPTPAPTSGNDSDVLGENEIIPGLVYKPNPISQTTPEGKLAEALVRDNMLDIPYTSWNPNYPNSTAKIIDYYHRKIVVINIGGINVPFYLSTGGGGKKNVPSGKWYPVFGIGADGWLNKTTEDEINNFYGIPLLKEIAHELDRVLGNIMDNPNVHLTGDTGDHINFINKHLTPTANHQHDTLQKIRENISKVEEACNKALQEAGLIEPPKVKSIEDIISEQNIILPANIKDSILSLDKAQQAEKLNKWIIANSEDFMHIPGKVVFNETSGEMSWEAVSEDEAKSLFKTWLALNFNLRNRKRFEILQIDGDLSLNDSWNSWDFSVSLPNGKTEKWVLGIGKGGYYYMPVSTEDRSGTTDMHRRNLKTFANSLGNEELYSLINVYNTFAMDQDADENTCEQYYNEIYQKLGEIDQDLQIQFEELICNYLEAKLNENEC